MAAFKVAAVVRTIVASNVSAVGGKVALPGAVTVMMAVTTVELSVPSLAW